jgi:hypothetical protein
MCARKGHFSTIVSFIVITLSWSRAKEAFMRFSGLAIATTLGLLILGGPVRSAGGEDLLEGSGPTSTLDVTWSLYVGGVPMGTATMNARLSGEAYKATARLETLGIVNRFWQSKIETASHGRIGEDRVQPAVYDSFATRQSGRRQEVTLRFDEEGPTSLVANPSYNEDRYPVSPEQKRHSLDPLSSLVFLTTSFRANEQKPCGVVAPVFDGRRRYDIAFRFVKKTDVRMDNGLYSGPVLVCEVEYRQVAGYQQRIVERGMKMPKIYAWVASIPSSSDPGRNYLIPIRLWTETEFGIISAVTSQLRVDGNAPARKG